MRRAHASSFGAAAQAYATHRPDYAPAAVRWALEHAPGLRVLDLGAGTGKLTGTLTTLDADVVAVEPDPAMLAELRRALPSVRARPGSAESIPLPDSSVDAVLAGNAMHWFDMGVAGPEIARVLVPGGILAGLWNVMDDRVDWVAGLERPVALPRSARGTPAPAGGPPPRPCICPARPGPRDSVRRSSPSFRTGSGARPTPSSRRWRRARACSSCRNRNARPPSAASARSSRAHRRRAVPNSSFRC